MSLSKFLFIFGAIITFCFLATAQRMDSYDKSLEIRRLTREFETLNSRKQELTLLIRTEHERLVLLSKNIGTPLTIGDVVILENTP